MYYWVFSESGIYSKKTTKITLTKEADYFEIRNISENSSPIDTKIYS